MIEHEQVPFKDLTVDAGIVGVIAGMHNRGIKTLYSCQGGGVNKAAYVMFDNNRDELIDLLDDWFEDDRSKDILNCLILSMTWSGEQNNWVVGTIQPGSDRDFVFEVDHDDFFGRGKTVTFRFRQKYIPLIESLLGVDKPSPVG